MKPTPQPAWRLEQDGFDPSAERQMETLFAIGNGYLGVRGAPDILIPASEADLFIAGVYDRKIPENPYSEPELLTKADRQDPYAEIVSFPFPFRLELRLEGAPLSLTGPELARHSRCLDLRQAIYFEEYRFSDAQGRKLQVRTRRCASREDPHLLLQEIEIASENYTGRLEAQISMEPKEEELAYPHLLHLDSGAPTGAAEAQVYQTLVSAIQCAFVSRIWIDDVEARAPYNALTITAGQKIRIQRCVSVFESRLNPRPLEQALLHAGQQSRRGLDIALAAHARRWTTYWENADVKLEGRPELTQAQRFNIYHLRIPATQDSDTSIGARALTGRAYEGHVFWDTEIFTLPFYLHTEPEIARNLLLYRYRTLPGARSRAHKMGYAGACYAWESTLTGEDVTPHWILIRGADREIPIFTGTQQVHVTADVVYALWRYWDATLDEEFLVRYGVEILIETARFWASRVTLSGGLFHIREVVGPDEYHFGVNDNAYTNWMARFNLERAVWATLWLRSHDPKRASDLERELSLRDEEVARWSEIARRMALPRINSEGVLEQFEGFFDLKKVEIPEEQRMKAPISRLFAWDEVNRLQILKQADVLMIPFLFPDALTPQQIAAIYDYYEPRTDHGSSLSVAVHAAIAGRLGRFAQAEDYWQKGLFFDLRNTMRNTPLGIHSGCIGGTWQALVFHLLGVRFTAKGPVVADEPWLPRGCPELELRLIYRGKRYPLRVRPRRKAVA